MFSTLASRMKRLPTGVYEFIGIVKKDRGYRLYNFKKKNQVLIVQKLIINFRFISSDLLKFFLIKTIIFLGRKVVTSWAAL